MAGRKEVFYFSDGHFAGEADADRVDLHTSGVRGADRSEGLLRVLRRIVIGAAVGMRMLAAQNHGTYTRVILQ